MKIRLVGHSKEPVMKVGTQGPWFDFQNKLTGYSNSVVDKSYGEPIDALVANSHSPLGIKECDRNNVPKNRRILILWEPKIVDPRTYSRRTLNNYGKIFAPSVDWAENLNAENFLWPQIDLEIHKPNFSNWDQRDNKASVVLANKFSASKGELYSLRREIAYKTQDKYLLDLFGSKWNLGMIYDFRHYFGNLVRTPLNNISLVSCRYLMRKFRNFKGLSENKFKTMEKYRISVVIENSADYISEKLFDSVSSGAITIYIGPRIEKYGLDINSVIQCEPKAEKVIEIVKTLQLLSSVEQRKIAESQYCSLLKSSPSWECHTVLKDLAIKVHNYLATTSDSV